MPTSDSTRRLARGRYVHGGYLIESDHASLDEWDNASDPEWFVYAPGKWENRNYGPPEAMTDGFPTKRDAVTYIQRRKSSDGSHTEQG